MGYWLAQEKGIWKEDGIDRKLWKKTNVHMRITMDTQKSLRISTDIDWFFKYKHRVSKQVTYNGP